jgi:dsRNA-specific ribonuclease
MAATSDLDWLKGLQLQINALLTPVIPTPETRNKFLGRGAMLIWARAFTHETVSPTDNYEDLEYLGDAILKAAFPKYLMERLPFMHKGEFTELNVAYMSKIKQAELARKMGLSPHIRVKGIERAILNLETDVFESFFGALDTIADMITPGSGFAYCYNMIVHIFNDVEIDVKKARGSAKTQVIQMFVRFDLSKPLEQVPGTNIEVEANPSLMPCLISRGHTDAILGHGISGKKQDAEKEAYQQSILFLQELGLVSIKEIYVDAIERRHVEFSVILRPEHLDFLARYGVTIFDPRIGLGVAPTKKEAESKAYAQALETLASYGITSDWAEEAKQALDFSDPAIAPYVVAADARLKREGYTSMYFFIPRKTVTPTGSIVQLVGVNPNGSHVVLAYTHATDRDNSYRTAKLHVIRQYAQSRST